MDGSEYPSKYMNSPAKTCVIWSAYKKTINLRTNAEFNMGTQKSDVDINEVWSLDNSGETLIIKQTSNTPWGKRDITAVYNRMKNETGY